MMIIPNCYVGYFLESCSPHEALINLSAIIDGDGLLAKLALFVQYLLASCTLNGVNGPITKLETPQLVAPDLPLLLLRLLMVN